MDSESAKLTPKRERFCQEYLIDHNATQAAIRAGYTKRSAQVTASRLLSNAMVQARLAELEAPILRLLEITREAVLREVALVAFSRIKSVVDVTERGVQPIPWDKVAEGDLAAVQEASQTVTESGGSTKVRMHDKVRALERLGDYLGLWWGDNLPAGPVEIRVNLVPVPKNPEDGS